MDTYSLSLSFNINFILIMNIQGFGATKASTGLKTNISEFTAQQIHIETVFGNNYFEVVSEILIPVNV